MTFYDYRNPATLSVTSRDMRSDWPLVVIGIVLSLSTAWGVGYVQAKDDAMRNGVPTSKVIESKQVLIRRCERLAINVRSECIFSAVSKLREEGRAEQQLTADQRSSWSAILSTIFAIGATIISIVGVVFVKKTFEATLTTLDGSAKAVEAMHSQNRLTIVGQRPWLAISNATCKAYRNYEGGVAFSISYDIVNFRDTPAINVFPIVEINSEDVFHGDTFPPLDFRNIGGSIVFPSETRREGNDNSLQGWTLDPMPAAISASVRITLRYNAMQGDEPMLTSMYFRVGALGSNESSLRLVNFSSVKEFHEEALDFALVPESRLDVIV